MGFKMRSKFEFEKWVGSDWYFKDSGVFSGDTYIAAMMQKSNFFYYGQLTFSDHSKNSVSNLIRVVALIRLRFPWPLKQSLTHSNSNIFYFLYSHNVSVCCQYDRKEFWSGIGFFTAENFLRGKEMGGENGTIKRKAWA